MAERTASGIGKFVIFTCEETGKKWGHIAAVWECIPSQPQTPLMKRVEFCRSSWNATPLLDHVADDDSEGLHPRFARLQVDKGHGEYTVNIYDIDYRTWDARCIWYGNQFFAFGVLGDAVFCKADDEWCRMDATSGILNKNPPFTPVTACDAFWIVEKPGETEGCWSYDRRNQQFVARFAEVKEPVDGFSLSKLSPDGKYRAWIVTSPPLGWNGGELAGRLILQRDGAIGDICVPIEFQAVPGSGLPVLPRHIQLEFAPARKLAFRAGLGEKPERDRVWSIDTVTGNVVAGEMPHATPAEDTRTTLTGTPVPDYLREGVEKLQHFGRSALAVAFLLHMGVIDKRPEYYECRGGVSQDGRHVLYKALKGPLSGEFVYGDLVTRQVVRWKSPDILKSCNAMDFLWVETPAPDDGSSQ